MTTEFCEQSNYFELMSYRSEYAFDEIDTLFYFKVKFGNLGFSLEKSENSGFLAQLSKRLKGEFIGYSWSGVRPS